MFQEQNHISLRQVISVVLGLYIILTALTVPNAVQSATYYVSTTGNNSNQGTEAQPWRTIQQAASRAVAGDIVYVKAGTYNERVVVANSGTAGNDITFSVYPNDVVTIDGSGITLPAWPSGLFDLEGRNYIKVSGFRVINAGPNSNNCGIYVDTCHDIIIENNYTYNTVSSGIGVWDSENIILDGNEVELACNDGEQECISVASTTNFDIRNNHVHHGGPGTNGGEGICPKDGSFNGRVYNNHVHDLPIKLGIYVDAWDKHTYNIEVFNNIVHDCGNDGFTLASEQGGLLENISVYNNIAYHNRNIGISVTPNGDVPNSPMKTLKIVNNTLFNNGWNTVADPWGGGIGVDSPNLTDLTIRNNIVSQNLLYEIAIESSGQNVATDHNLIDGFRGELTEETRGSSFVEGAPGVVDASGADFHLIEGALAIDKGVSTDAPAADYDGNPRPQGVGYDIGAFEYSANPVAVDERASPIPEKFELRQNYPNPFNAGTDISYQLTESGKVMVTVYNLLGEPVRVLVNEEQAPGDHFIHWDAKDDLGRFVSSGVYLYQIHAGSFSDVRKAVFVK